MNIEIFVKENIPNDVIWKDKVIKLVYMAYELGLSCSHYKRDKKWHLNFHITDETFERFKRNKCLIPQDYGLRDKEWKSLIQTHCEKIFIESIKNHEQEENLNG